MLDLIASDVKSEKKPVDSGNATKLEDKLHDVVGKLILFDLQKYSDFTYSYEISRRMESHDLFLMKEAIFRFQNVVLFFSYLIVISFISHFSN